MFYSDLLQAIVKNTTPDASQSVFEVAFDTALSAEAKAILSFHNLLNCKQERNGFILFPADIILEKKTGYCSDTAFIPFAAVKNKSTCLAIRCDGTSEFVVLNRKGRVLDDKGFDFKSFLELIKKLQPAKPDIHLFRIVRSSDGNISVYLSNTRMPNKNDIPIDDTLTDLATVLMGKQNNSSAPDAQTQPEQDISSASDMDNQSEQGTFPASDASIQAGQGTSPAPDASAQPEPDNPPVPEHNKLYSEGAPYSIIQEPPFDLEGAIDISMEASSQPENSTAYKPFCFSEFVKREKEEARLVAQSCSNAEENAVQPCGDENKHDGDKVRLDLVEPSLIDAVGRIRTFGIKKYPDEQSWRKVSKQRYVAATMRHFEAYRSGELLDPESGLPHLWHVACNIMFLIELEKK